MVTALVPLAEGFEDLEAVTIVDLLRRAGMDVVTAGLEEGLVTGARGTRVLPDSQLQDELDREFDLVALPGGLPGADHLRDDDRLIALLQKQAEAGRWVAAICAAPQALAKAGLLQGKRVTSYPGVLSSLALQDTVVTDEAVVVDGKVVTSRGPGTAMDFALSLIGCLSGDEARVAVEGPLER